MGLQLNSAPATLPVTLAEARAQLRLDASGSPAEHPDDDYVTRLLNAATARLDGKDGLLSRCLITQTWDYTIDEFPAERSILLPLGPLQSVSSITYTDTDGVTQTFSSSSYVVDDKSERGWVVLASGEAWPSTYDVINAVTIRFIAGYGDAASDVPEEIRHAILLMVAQWYEHRKTVHVGQGTVEELPIDIGPLISRYRTFGFA